jgi:hypothetical protein
VTRGRLRMFLAVICLAHAASASAKQDDGLWEHLSGPGPFVRFPAVEYRFACFTSVGGRTHGTILHPWDGGATAEFAHRRHPQPAPSDTKAVAHKECAEDRNVRAYVTVAYGHYFSLENNLFPDNLTDDAFAVKAESASIRFMSRTAGGTLDVGVGADVFWFHGKSFDSFTRLALEPVRVAVAPFAALSDSARARSFQLVVAPAIILGTLDQSDFCNTAACSVAPRPFRSRLEVVWATNFSVDVVTLISGK